MRLDSWIALLITTIIMRDTYPYYDYIAVDDFIKNWLAVKYYSTAIDWCNIDNSRVFSVLSYSVIYLIEEILVINIIHCFFSMAEMHIVAPWTLWNSVDVLLVLGNHLNGSLFWFSFENKIKCSRVSCICSLILIVLK